MVGVSESSSLSEPGRSPHHSGAFATIHVEGMQIAENHGLWAHGTGDSSTGGHQTGDITDERVEEKTRHEHNQHGEATEAQAIWRNGERGDERMVGE